MTIQEFKAEFRLASDKGDPWGEAMSAHFECAAQLYVRGAEVPAHWEYNAGPCDDPTEEENYYHELFAAATNEELVSIGNLLCRLSSILDHLELSY